ncbi:hypothetical protein CVD28_02315 [Bacillus sp. M6-12]|uniref:hypothetical protein n=1 Tax=Bacillus sp. M6-12 TaxID=2054166 RepID=UPI000C78B7B1|nr:hypothetical protein [Bacillus sp. M6-12]PLS19267.1 hypothetical protein CVD28_02315 [Bacillus sp. M6-12]
MALTNKDKNFLIKSMAQSKKVLKIFGKGIPEKDIAFLQSIEPAIKSDTLNEDQIKFLVKNMNSVYLTTKSKYVKRELIPNLESLLVTEKESEETPVEE